MSIVRQAVTHYIYENVQRWRKDIRLNGEQRVTVLLAICDREQVDEEHLTADWKIDFMWMVEPFAGMMMFPMSAVELAQARGVGYLAPGAKWPEASDRVALCNARAETDLQCILTAGHDGYHDNGSVSFADGDLS